VKKKTIVYIAPHLSTGGMPQYLFKQIESIKDDFDVYCIEWDNVTGGVLVVQRNKIEAVLGKNLITLGENKDNLFSLLDAIKPDVIHLQEIPELFMASAIADKLYAVDRPYVLIETSHDSSYSIANKKYLPDKFLLVSKYQIDEYIKLGIPTDLVEYPIKYKTRTNTREQAQRKLGLDPTLKHVINVGLFTPRKNQAEVIEYARRLSGQPIQFHFIGNQADNFKDYWEPLMQNFPSNCKWWNERSDIDAFYEAADLFLFTSKGNSHDKETMPLVIREALGWKTPSLIYNLPVYMGYFDAYDTIEYLTDSIEQNVDLIVKKLAITPTNVSKEIFYTLDGELSLASYTYKNDTTENLHAFGEAAAQYWYTFIAKELDKGTVRVNPGDVFVDLGANIGMSAKYAVSRGAAEVYCFEPDPIVADLLQKNVPTAKVYKVAITDTNTTLQLYHWPHNPTNIGPMYTCSTMTLRQVLAEVGKKIDYLKIDIEGAEKTLFDDLTLAECAQIDKLMVEYHHADGLDTFCLQLERLGFQIEFIDNGHQAFIYAKYIGIPKFQSHWDLNTQTVYYSVDRKLNYPVLVSLKEYKSDAVLWSSIMDNLESGVEYWMRPVDKSVHAYDVDPLFTGVKLCLYDSITGEQLYEHPYVHQFVNMPTVTLSNYVPYHFNYVEYFIKQKYGKWISRTYDTVVDAGANVGVFTAYMITNGYAKNVIAIECDHRALHDLNNNFKHNTNVQIIGKALHSSESPITFYHSPDNPVISSTLAPDRLESHMAGVKGNVEITVPTVTIEQLVKTYGTIDLLKIDIEGGEYQVLLSTIPTTFESINNLFIEFHFFEKDYKENYKKVLDMLQSIGYEVEEFTPSQSDNAGTSECIFATRKLP
jgi:FkbM family methyltransferase